MTSPVSEKVPESLRHFIESAPQQPLGLIVRVRHADDETQTHLESAGLIVRYRLTLVPQFIVTGPGQAILPLLEEEWLVGVEADGPVHTWQQASSNREGEV